MSNIILPYGDHSLEAFVPDDNLLQVVRPRRSPSANRDEASIILDALANPIGSPQLRAIAHPGQKVCIVTSDLTRPCPSERVLPYLLDELSAAGVADEDIFIVIGLGIHRPMSRLEIEQAIGPDVVRRVRVYNHDVNDVTHLGITSHGTPVEFFRPLVEAELRICLGVLEFHWFAGFSGGAKAILPGAASRATILANHGLMVQPGVGSGRNEGNPLRMDLEEGAAMLGIDFILNVDVDDTQRIVGAVAGDWIEAHRRGCSIITERGAVRVEHRVDIVIAGAGGYPKDINMFQAHKGMENAAYFVRNGGVLIFAAECREGWGNPVFESWMKSADSPQVVLDRITQAFEFGGHKAAGIARIVKRANVCLVSSMPEQEVHKMFLNPVPSIQTAINTAFSTLGSDSQVLALPEAGSIIPDPGWPID